jgi:hypothetical protein
MKVSRLLLISSVVFLLSLSAEAQEETPIIEGPDPSHREINFSEDKTLLSDQPVQIQQPGVRDSLVVLPRPVNQTTRPEAQREGQKPRTEEDALRFNFLYYIIQKYKISDIIEN